MNHETAPAALCALRLGDDVLSAWRDVELRGAQARRMEAHLASCVPCQVRLSAYETLGTLLRAQPIPEPRPNALIELNARIVARHPRRVSARFERTSTGRFYLPHPGSWRGLLLLIGALLLAAFFARLLTAGLQLPAGHLMPYVAPHSATTLTASIKTLRETLWPAKTF